ncbi:hypothetical protein SCLCIDRAFT_1214983 [Scleroderma citrinum Foug A]|uniref:Uncharacterized protein n=1 Tax=Scleroderma citrinum Foug A TaxID=1036808 RepID=A0A0C3E1N1_9AGAM|nr:hypothetical protein SCLCIDRAFT_1214983 [Scleroderma citrinum Foug A]
MSSGKIEYVWRKPMSVVTLMYLVLRYFVIITILFSTGVLLSDWNSSNQFNNHTFPAIQGLTLLIPYVLVQIILQMRLYALYNRSKRVMFVVVLGFIIEITAMPVAATFRGRNLLGENCFRCSSSANRNGARHLRGILIEGNVIYFIAMLLYLLVFLPLYLASPDEFLNSAANFLLCVASITGCRLILDIRSATSQSSAGINASQGQMYSLVVFRDRTTHDSTNVDTPSE